MCPIGLQSESNRGHDKVRAFGWQTVVPRHCRGMIGQKKRVQLDLAATYDGWWNISRR